jgi:hypothetical protein
MPQIASDAVATEKTPEFYANAKKTRRKAQGPIVVARVSTAILNIHSQPANLVACDCNEQKIVFRNFPSGKKIISI